MAEITKLVHKYLRHDKKFPHVWCPGCGNGIVLGAMIRAIDRLGYSKDEIVMVSGIGCSGRLPVYVDFSTLHTTHGRALTFATGVKLAKPELNVIVVMGDGETQEGQVWEAAMAAAHFNLGNLTAIIDYNKFQGDGPVNETLNLEPLADKWRAFGWNVIEIDGHDYDQIIGACERAKSIKDKPIYVIAHTVKGKGVSFMENVASWHGSNVPNSKSWRGLSQN